MTLTSPTPTFTTALATTDDLTDVCTAFHSMLHDLAPLGHDVLPTRHNVAWFAANIFEPALQGEDHGIYLARSDAGECIGCTFFTPDPTPLDTPVGRVTAHGIWIHPDHRRQGLALLLQDEAHQHLRQLGYTSLVSNVVAGNIPGLASAKAAGARVTGFMTTVELGGRS